MQFLIFSDLAGRFHPVIVHLPIGILVLACFFELISSSPRFTSLKPAVPHMFFWGMISAIFAILTGLILAQGDDYDESEIFQHQWTGISLGVASVVLYISSKKNLNRKLIKAFSTVTLILIILTGHFGGSITHGSDYLTAPITNSNRSASLKPIPNIQEAVLYTDIVQPIFQARCYNCHSSKKQKGKLRVDEKEFILKGGESGKVIVPGKPEESEMIERLLLPPDNEDHMPPKRRPQLTKEEIKLLHWWVSNGADFNKKVSEFKQTAAIKPVLLALETGSSSENKISNKEQSVAPGDTAVIRSLISAGVMIVPIAMNSNYLSANFLTIDSSINDLLKQMEPLKKQLISLKVEGEQIDDSSVSIISQYPSLRRVHLTNTRVTDKGLAFLVSLKELHTLNLVGTSVTAKGLLALSKLKNLEHLYLNQTPISSVEQVEIKKNFPNTNIDFGNYTVPTFAEDTTEVKIN
ncbi:MAG: c-type cytochrome domain-containing protein [Flavitalea sp.]